MTEASALEGLSFEALALLTLLRGGHEPDSPYVREVFTQEWPEKELEEAVTALKDRGLIDEPVPLEAPSGVRFRQRSRKTLRVY